MSPPLGVAYKAIQTDFQIECRNWQLDDEDHDGGEPNATNFGNAVGLEFEFWTLMEGDASASSVSYKSASGRSGFFPLPQGNVKIIARMTETVGGGTTSVDFEIPIVVVKLTQEEIETILNDPTVLKTPGMSPDDAVLKYMAAGGSVGTGARRRRRWRNATPSEQLVETMAKRHNVLAAVVQELGLSFAKKTLTTNLISRVLTAMANNVGGGNPVPIKFDSVVLAANSLRQLADSGLVVNDNMLSFAVVINNAMSSLLGDTSDALYRQQHMPALDPPVLPSLPGGAAAGLATAAEQKEQVAVLLGTLETAVGKLLAAAPVLPANPLFRVSNRDPNAEISAAQFDYFGGRVSNCDSISGSLEVGGAGAVAVTVPREHLGCLSGGSSGVGTPSAFSMYRFDRDPHRWFTNRPTSEVVSFAVNAVGVSPGSRRARDASGCYKIAFPQDAKVAEKRAYSVVHRLAPHTTLVLEFDRTEAARQQAVQIIVEPFTMVGADRARTAVQATLTGHMHVNAGVGVVASPADPAPFDHSFAMKSNRKLPAAHVTDISDPAHVLQIVPSSHANHACSDAKTAVDPFVGSTAKYTLALETSSTDAVDVLVRIWHEECVNYLHACFLFTLQSAHVLIATDHTTSDASLLTHHRVRPCCCAYRCVSISSAESIARSRKGSGVRCRCC